MGRKFLARRRVYSGFTLIELLVVIAIIGILATIVIVNVSSARKKSRDAKRITDMKQILTAEEIYYDNNGQYVPPLGGGNGPDLQLENLNNTLKTAGLITQDFKDPSKIDNYYNFIWPNGNPADPGDESWGWNTNPPTGLAHPCDPARGGHLLLGIVSMESVSGVHPSSSGVSCGNHYGSFPGVAGGWPWGAERFNKQ